MHSISQNSILKITDVVSSEQEKYRLCLPKQFKTPTVIATGCPHSGWQKAIPLLEEAGLETTGDTFARWHDELFRTGGMVDPLQLGPPMGQVLQTGGKVARLFPETPAGPRLLADSRSLWLLDYWSARLPHTRFILFYSRAEAALAHACLQGINAQQLIEEWQTVSHQLLKFQRRHRRRALLLDAEAAVRNPQAMIEVCQRIGLTLQPLLQESEPASAPTTVERFLACEIIAGLPEIQALQMEMEASAHPLGDPPNEELQPLELFNDYEQRMAKACEQRERLLEAEKQLQMAEREKVERKEQLERLQNQKDELNKLHDEQVKLTGELTTRLEPLQEQNQALEAAKKEAAHENELLLLQLHQVQEELEETFLKQQQLEQMKNDLYTDLQNLQAQIEKVTQIRDEQEKLSAQLRVELEQAQKKQNTQREQFQVQIDKLTKARDELAKQKAERDNRLEQLQNDCRTLEAAKKEADQENELLLLQLHKVQEELEETFLKRQQLEQVQKNRDTDLQKLQAQIDELTRAQDELAKQKAERDSRLEQLQNDCRTLETAKKEAAQENELLLLQLHQVQEELEEIFLRNQNLKQAYQRLETSQKEASQAKEGEIKKQHQRVTKLKKTVSWKIISPFRALARHFKASTKERKKTKNQINLLKSSGHFDEAWYLAVNDDVAGHGIDPVEHYILHGAAEGRNPSPSFNTRRYLEINPDVADAGMNPLVHFVKYGMAEERCAV